MNKLISPMLQTSGIKIQHARKTNYTTSQISAKAQNQWISILESLGVPLKFLNKKHSSCPFCGGTDRYRFDDKEGKGTFICNQCGAGVGIQFVMRYFDCSHAEAVTKVSMLLNINTRAPSISYVENEKNKLYQMVRQLADYMIKRSVYNDNHPYANHKQIQLHNLRVYKESMIVKVFHGRKELASLQLIDPNGKKRFLKGTHKTGSYSIIGKHKESQPLIIAEGFATAASIYQSLNIPVFIAFDCGNLKAALQTILSNFKFNGKIIVAGDNDSSNAGYKFAKEALSNLNVHGYIVMPEITPGCSKADWNDVYVKFGKEVVVKAFEEVLK